MLALAKAMVAAEAEAATGLTSLVLPFLVGRLLLGEELTGVAHPIARLPGIALIKTTLHRSLCSSKIDYET